MSTHDSYPRVLHLGFTELGAPNSTALALQRAFGQWPAECLLQACFRPNTTDPRVLNILGGGQRSADALVNRLMRRTRPVSGGAGLPPDSEPGARERLRYFATMMGDLRPSRVPGSVQSRVRVFGPEVIHSNVSGLRSMRIAMRMARHLGVPLVPHFMDDWPSTLFSGVPAAAPVRRLVRRTLQDLLTAAPEVLVVGSAMAEEYALRYGVSCTVVGNCASPVTVQRSDATHQGLIYVGGLENDRWEMVAALASMVDAGFPIRLFTPPAHVARAQQLQRRHPAILSVDTVAPEEVPGLLQTCAALLFVESTREPALTYTRLSVSGKVAQYLMSRRPILAVGPAEQGSIRALRDSPMTVYAGQADDREQLSAALAGLRELPQTPIPDQTWNVLVSTFGCRGTQERLRMALHRAAHRA